MSQNKLNALIALAKVAPSDEFTQKATAAMPTKLREALERKRKEQEDRATEEAAEAIMEAVQAAEETKSVLIEKIRDARRLIDDCKKQLDKIDLTIRYGYETQNYLPLVHHILGAGLGKSSGQWSFNFTCCQSAKASSTYIVRVTFVQVACKASSDACGDRGNNAFKRGPKLTCAH